MKSSEELLWFKDKSKTLVPFTPQLLKRIEHKAAVSLDVMPYVPAGRRHVVAD